MKTITRTLGLLVCLVLCLAVAVPTAPAYAQDAKKQSQPQTSPKKTDKSSKASKSDKSKSSKTTKKSGDQGEAKKKPRKVSSEGGFRGLAWGSPLSVLKEPELREETGEMRYYTVPDDDMDVFGVAMREIVYVFCKGKLAGALARYDGEIKQLVLLGQMNEKLGAPIESQPNTVGDRSWRYDSGEQTIMMEYSQKGSTGALVWFGKGPLAPCQAAPAP